MIVGMVTVFAVLLIIINLSELLIQCVNKIAPEETTAKKKIRSIRVILGVASVSLRRRVGVQEQQE